MNRRFEWFAEGWFAEGWFNPQALDLQEKNLYTLHFLHGSTLSVSAIVREVDDSPHDWQAGILARNSNDLST